MNLKPLNDRILVKRDEAEGTTDAGLIIPDDAKKKALQGEVIAVGPGPFIDGTEKRRAIGLEPGQKVCWEIARGTEIELDGVPHVVLQEDEIQGVVTD